MEGIPRAGHKLYICFSGITTWVTFTKMQSNAAIILTLDISTIASIALKTWLLQAIFLSHEYIMIVAKAFCIQCIAIHSYHIQ